MLSISDWIAFLTSEKNPNIGIVVGFTAFMIAAVAVIMSVANNNWGSIVGAALICVALVIVYYKISNLYFRHAKIAGQLLEDIMSGKERDPSEIEKRWNEGSKKGKKKNK